MSMHRTTIRMIFLSKNTALETADLRENFQHEHFSTPFEDLPRCHQRLSLFSLGYKKICDYSQNVLGYWRLRSAS